MWTVEILVTITHDHLILQVGDYEVVLARAEETKHWTDVKDIIDWLADDGTINEALRELNNEIL